MLVSLVSSAEASGMRETSQVLMLGPLGWESIPLHTFQGELGHIFELDCDAKPC